MQRMFPIVTWFCFSILTFLDNSRKNSLARSDILLSLSSKHVAISLIWPLTLTMSFRIRCVSTISVFLRTWPDSSRNLSDNIQTAVSISICEAKVAGIYLLETDKGYQKLRQSTKRIDKDRRDNTLQVWFTDNSRARMHKSKCSAKMTIQRERYTEWDPEFFQLTFVKCYFLECGPTANSVCICKFNPG